MLHSECEALESPKECRRALKAERRRCCGRRNSAMATPAQHHNRHTHTTTTATAQHTHMDTHGQIHTLEQGVTRGQIAVGVGTVAYRQIRIHWSTYTVVQFSVVTAMASLTYRFPLVMCPLKKTRKRSRPQAQR